MLKRILRRMKKPEFIERTVDAVFFAVKVAMVITIPLFLWSFTKALSKMREAAEAEIKKEEVLKSHIQALQDDSAKKEFIIREEFKPIIDHSEIK
jgi:hypothetical protein